MKFERVKGDVPVFSEDYDGRDRTIFGGTEQSNDINDQFTPEFKNGWGIVGKNGFPTLQDFNALGFTHSTLLSYLYQNGVPEWDSTTQYYIGATVSYAGELWISKRDIPTSAPTFEQIEWKLVISGDVFGDGAVVKKSALDDAMPVGVIVSWDHEEAPKNWLFVRDQKFSATEYPELAKLYPSLTLNDRRGTVDRALDAGRGYDAGRVLGSYQEDAVQNITGDINLSSFSSGSPISTGAKNGALLESTGINGGGGGNGVRGITEGLSVNNSTVIKFNASNSVRTSNETRMKNVATNKIIKAK